MSKSPKIVPIRDSYKNLFKDEERQIQSPQDIARKMRAIIKLEKSK